MLRDPSPRVTGCRCELLYTAPCGFGWETTRNCLLLRSGIGGGRQGHARLCARPQVVDHRVVEPFAW